MTFLLPQHQPAVHIFASQLSGALSSPLRRTTSPRIILRGSVRAMSATPARADPFKPAARVAGQRQDVWYVCPCFRNSLQSRALG